MNELLYRTLERVIENAQRQHLPTDDIEARMDVFLAAGKLTVEKYQELVEMMSGEAATGTTTG